VEGTQHTLPIKEKILSKTQQNIEKKRDWGQKMLQWQTTIQKKKKKNSLGKIHWGKVMPEGTNCCNHCVREKE